MERKKLYEILGSLFVAAIMIGSFAAYGGSSSGINPQHGNNQSTNSTPFWHATNSTLAEVKGYDSFFYITVNCKNATASQIVLNKTYNILNEMNLTATEIGDRIDVLSSSSPISTYLDISKNVDSGELDCINMHASADISLPQRLILHLNYIYNPDYNTTISFSVPQGQVLQKVPLMVNSSSYNQSIMNVRITSLLTRNFTLYGNFSVSRA